VASTVLHQQTRAATPLHVQVKWFIDSGSVSQLHSTRHCAVRTWPHDYGGLVDTGGVFQRTHSMIAVLALSVNSIIDNTLLSLLLLCNTLYLLQAKC
jgi:hypothetical protein